MPGQRQPTNIVLLKGKKHLTKKEADERLAREVNAPSDNIKPPGYLTKKQKEEFQNIADQLIQIKIMSNLDCDALARFIIARDDYIRFVRMSRRRSDDLDTMERISRMKDRAFKESRSAAADLGLTISSRCKLTIPLNPPAKTPAAEGNRKTNFEEEFGDV